MKITDIKQQVKRADRYSIFVDEKYSFSLSERALLQGRLRLAQEVTQQELDVLKDTAKRDKAYNQALGLIARRLRSEWEVRDYLKRKEYDVEFIEEVIERLYAARFLDDEEFARRWVDNRRLLKSTSKRRLTMELRQKRVAEEIIKQTLEADETDERSVLRELIARKRKQSRYQDEQKLLAYLMRQGFSYEDVRSALQNNVED